MNKLKKQKIAISLAVVALLILASVPLLPAQEETKTSMPETPTLPEQAEKPLSPATPPPTPEEAGAIPKTTLPTDVPVAEKVEKKTDESLEKEILAQQIAKFRTTVLEDKPLLEEWETQIQGVDSLKSQIAAIEEELKSLSELKSAIMSSRAIASTADIPAINSKMESLENKKVSLLDELHRGIWAEKGELLTQEEIDKLSEEERDEYFGTPEERITDEEITKRYEFAKENRDRIIEKYDLKEAKEIIEEINSLSKEINTMTEKVVGIFNQQLSKYAGSIAGLESLIGSKVYERPSDTEIQKRVTELQEKYKNLATKKDNFLKTGELEIPPELESQRDELTSASARLGGSLLPAIAKALEKRDNFLKECETNIYKLFFLFRLGFIDRNTLENIFIAYGSPEDAELIAKLSLNADIYFEEKIAKELSAEKEDAMKRLYEVLKENAQEGHILGKINIFALLGAFKNIEDVRVREVAWKTCTEQGHQLLMFLKKSHGFKPAFVKEQLGKWTNEELNKLMKGYKEYDPSTFEKPEIDSYGKTDSFAHLKICLQQFLSSPDADKDIAMSEGSFDQAALIAYLINKGKAAENWGKYSEADEWYRLAEAMGELSAKELREKIAPKIITEKYGRIAMRVTGDPITLTLGVGIALVHIYRTKFSWGIFGKIANLATSSSREAKKAALAYHTAANKLRTAEALGATEKKITSLTKEVETARAAFVRAQGKYSKLVEEIKAANAVAKTGLKENIATELKNPKVLTREQLLTERLQPAPTIVRESADDLAKSAANVIRERVAALFPKNQLPAGWKISQTIEVTKGKETIWIRALNEKGETMGLVQFTIDRSKNTVTLGGIQLDTLKRALGILPEQGTGVMSGLFREFIEKKFNGWTFKMGEPLAPHTAKRIIDLGGMVQSELGEQFSPSFTTKLAGGKVTQAEYTAEIAKWKGIAMTTPVKIGAGPESMIEMYKTSGWTDAQIRELLSAIGKTDDEIRNAFKAYKVSSVIVTK